MSRLSPAIIVLSTIPVLCRTYWNRLTLPRALVLHDFLTEMRDCCSPLIQLSWQINVAPLLVYWSSTRACILELHRVVQPFSFRSTFNYPRPSSILNKMATAAVQLPPSIHTSPGVQSSLQDTQNQKHDVTTTLYYYKDPGDGSAPEPTYIG
jgi:hypothetical protein